MPATQGRRKHKGMREPENAELVYAPLAVTYWDDAEQVHGVVEHNFGEDSPTD